MVSPSSTRLSSWPLSRSIGCLSMLYFLGSSSPLQTSLSSFARFVTCRFRISRTNTIYLRILSNSSIYLWLFPCVLFCNWLFPIPPCLLLWQRGVTPLLWLSSRWAANWVTRGGGWHDDVQRYEFLLASELCVRWKAEGGPCCGDGHQVFWQVFVFIWL
jgi:hypothetical protein